VRCDMTMPMLARCKVLTLKCWLSIEMSQHASKGQRVRASDW
jgi:hypothetical protein